MNLFGISIRGDAENLLRDNYITTDGTPIGGVLLFKKKSSAQEEADSMNRLRKGLKLSECYSVVKVEESNLPTIYGKIVDGKQA